MDGCDVERIFLRRAIVMRTVPMCIRGPYRHSHESARVEVVLALDPHVVVETNHLVGGLVSQEKLLKRFEMFAGGRWEELLRDSEAQESTAATLRRRRRRRSDNVEDRPSVQGSRSRADG